MTSVVSYQSDPSYPELYGSGTASTLFFFRFNEEPALIPKENYKLAFDPSLFISVWPLSRGDEFLLRFEEKRKIDIIQNFASRLIENSVDLDPIFAKIAKDYFWDLV